MAQQKQPTPHELADRRFHKNLQEITAEYTSFWKRFFADYGFVIDTTEHYFVGDFQMTFGQQEISCSCCPSRYMGIKLRYGKSFYGGDSQKVMSESGAIKWMKKNGLGRPPIKA